VTHLRITNLPKWRQTTQSSHTDEDGISFLPFGCELQVAMRKRSCTSWKILFFTADCNILSLGCTSG